MSYEFEGLPQNKYTHVISREQMDRMNEFAEEQTKQLMEKLAKGRVILIMPNKYGGTDAFGIDMDNIKSV